MDERLMSFLSPTGSPFQGKVPKTLGVRIKQVRALDCMQPVLSSSSTLGIQYTIINVSSHHCPCRRPLRFPRPRTDRNDTRLRHHLRQR